jgi:hypothetical protein
MSTTPMQKRNLRFERTIAIDESDLAIVARAIALRCPAPADDAARAARMRAMVEVTAQLNRMLGTYARHALVNCQGTAGASDLDLDTRLLTEALRDFCAEVRTVAAEYAGAMLQADAS